ncbi:hypothetical protein [Streptomyces xinghaiensis]|uniref:hypothetical protein n=1 Tax=Streptomyces xinghaiensis TaxID=1038928 RepID=UPI002E0E9C65|nr:hypothetical protein OG463_21955 [Streptomyces xinghaiensis]
MIGAAVFTGAFAVAFLAFALFVDPRKLWWRFRARHFEHPEAHEPSAASFLWRRVLLGVLGLVLVWQCVELLRLAGVFKTGLDHAEVLERVENAALNLETGKDGGQYKMPVGEGSWGFFIDPRLKGPGDDPVAHLVSATDAEGDGEDVERYEIDGICLTVRAKPDPGQSEMDHAIDNLTYRVKTDVVDSPCEES